MESPGEAPSYQMSEQVLKSYSRLEKGYFFELYVQNLLLKQGIEFIGNPRNFDAWKRHTNTGYDIKVRIDENSWLRVECKFVLKKIYHSWFLRDWLSRNCDLIITNDPSKLSEQDRQLLESRGIKLLTPNQFIIHITNLVYNNRVTRFILNLMKNRDKLDTIETDKIKESCTDEGNCFSTAYLSRENDGKTTHSINLSKGKNIRVVLKETFNLSSNREIHIDYRSLIQKCLKCPYLDGCEVCLFYNKLSYESCEFFNYDCSTCGVRRQCKEMKQKLDDILHQVLCKYPEFMNRNTWRFKDPYNQRFSFISYCCEEYCPISNNCRKWNYLRCIKKSVPELLYDEYQNVIQDLENFLKWKIERCIYVRMRRCWEKSFSPKVYWDLKELEEYRRMAETYTPEEWKEYFNQILRTDYKTWLQMHSEQSMGSEVI